MTDHFKLDPEFFPIESKAMIPVADILKWKILPLGFKKHSGVFGLGASRRLNIGMVEPKNAAAVQYLRQYLSGKSSISLKIYQIDAEEFDEVVRRVYGAAGASATPSAEMSLEISKGEASRVREASHLSSNGNTLTDALRPHDPF